MKKTEYKGFTLIELLVVIAIIGILSAIVLTSLASARFAAQNSATNQSVGQYQVAMMNYYEENGSWPLIWDGIDTYSGCFDQGTCITLDKAYPSDTAAWAALLKPYISEIKPINNAPLYYFGFAYQGLWHSCIKPDISSNRCYVMRFEWVIANSTKCSVANAVTFTDASTGNSLCYVDLPY